MSSYRCFRGLLTSALAASISYMRCVLFPTVLLRLGLSLLLFVGRGAIKSLFLFLLGSAYKWRQVSQISAFFHVLFGQRR